MFAFMRGVPNPDTGVTGSIHKACFISTRWEGHRRALMGLIEGTHLMKLLVLALTATVLAATPLESVAAGSVREEMRWHGWVPGGQVVEINNIHGNVRAEAALGDEIEVFALKRGTDDPGDVS